MIGYALAIKQTKISISSEFSKRDDIFLKNQENVWWNKKMCLPLHR